MSIVGVGVPTAATAEVMVLMVEVSMVVVVEAIVALSCFELSLDHLSCLTH